MKMKQTETDYLSLIEAQPSGQTAMVCGTAFGSRSYTYGGLAAAARRLREQILTESIFCLYPIREQRAFDQLLHFLAASGTGLVPVILPLDMRLSKSFLETKIPETACMAAATSGTTGNGKLLFRTLESWHSYFPIQNQLFGMGAGSRLFIQGSLAFTGNLNLCLAQLSNGGTVIVQEAFDPRLWIREIEENTVDVIYLIPAKLRALKRLCQKSGRQFAGVRTVLTGSQSLGKREAEELALIFPEAELILYYGASELNYVTYVYGHEMNGDQTLIGRSFPGVRVSVEEGKICVTTDWAVIGLGEQSFIGDYGHFDDNGLLYFDGRQDDICNINGIKVSAIRVENALIELEEVSEAAVKAVRQQEKDYLAAWIVFRHGSELDVPSLRRKLETKLSQAEIPRKYYALAQFPRNESGKILKRELIP